MKNNITISIITLIVLIAISFAKATAKEVTMKSFHSNQNYTGLKVSRSVNLTIEDRTEGNIVAIGSEETLSVLDIKVENNILMVTIPNNVKIVGKGPEVRIPNNGRISKIKVSSAASVKCIPVIKGIDLEIECSSASQFTGTLEVMNLEAEFQSAAHGTISGKANKAEIELGSSAKLDCQGLHVDNGDIEASSASRISATVDNCKIETSSASKANITCRRCIAKASSASSIDVNCSESLTAEASSGAKIKVSGNCEVKSKTSSGGSVNKF